MDTLIKADVFFFITSVAIVVVGALLAIALLYAIKILRNVRDVSDRVKEETDSVANDFGKFRSKIREEGFQWKHVKEFLGIEKKRKPPH